MRAAPFFPRAAAYLLDRLIVGTVLLLPRLITFFRSLGTDALSRAVLFRLSAADILWWTLGVTYFILLTAATGSTLGKKAMGLTVVTKEGGKPTFITVVCRETFGRYLSSLLCIGYILCAVDPEQGALHDRICDTRVVYAPRKAERYVAAPAPAASVTPAAPRCTPGAPGLPLPPAGNSDWYAPNL